MLENLRFHAEEENERPGVRAGSSPRSPTSTSTTRSARRTALTPRPRASRTTCPRVRRACSAPGGRDARQHAPRPGAAVRRHPRRHQGLGQVRRHRRRMLDLVDTLLIGGGMASRSSSPRASRSARRSSGTMGRAAQRDAREGRRRRGDLVLPADFVVAAEAIADDADTRVAPPRRSPPTCWALDIGPQTDGGVQGASCAARGRSSGTGRWACSRSPFEAGTREVAEAIAATTARVRRRRRRLRSAAALFDLEDRVTFVSTGGGASMKLLEGRALPGVEALMDRPAAATTAGRRPLMAGNWKMYKTRAERRLSSRPSSRSSPALATVTCCSVRRT